MDSWVFYGTTERKKTKKKWKRKEKKWDYFDRSNGGNSYQLRIERIDAFKLHARFKS